MNLIVVKNSEFLQRSISVLYYSLEAMDTLVDKGFLKGRSERTSTMEKAGFFSFLEDFERCTFCGKDISNKNCCTKGRDSIKKVEKIKREKGESWWNDWGRCGLGIFGNAVATVGLVSCTGTLGVGCGAAILGKAISMVTMIDSC